MIELRSALRLYLVADPEQCDDDLVECVQAAIRGGVNMVQLRAKHLGDLEHFNLATRMRTVCCRHGVPFLVNDRMDIALASGADGVHLGVDDLPLEAARALGGNQFIIGFSPESDDQLRRAAECGADYLGIGPVFSTSTKADAGQAMGLQRFSERVGLSDLPVAGIGGITVDNYEEVMMAGAAGIAVVSAILRANDAETAARQLSRN